MTDANREEAQKELRQVISDSFVNHTLWTTDWDGVQLQRCVPPGLCYSSSHFGFVCSSLLPKQPIGLQPTNNLKRKL